MEGEPKQPRFLKDSEDREYLAICDALIGETNADNFRQTIVRSEFLKEFWPHKKVQDLVSRWAKLTGLEELALRLARAGDLLVELAGLSFRGDLKGSEDLTFDEDQVEEAEAAVAELEAAFQDFETLLEHPKHTEDIGQEATGFVKSLGLPYPWLAMELIKAAFRSICGFALGLKIKIEG